MTRLADSPAAHPGTSLADARLASEYHALKLWLMGILRRRSGLDEEDREEIVDDTLLAWHRTLCREPGVRSDRAFCAAVLRKEMAGRLRRASVQTLPLPVAENLGVDPQLDVLMIEREQSCELQELAADTLTPDEYALVRLAELGVPRAALAECLGLSPRQLRRRLDRAQARLTAARQVLEERGLCKMFALTIADIKAGTIGPGDRRWRAGMLHLARCSRCRRSCRTEPAAGQTASA